MATAIVRFDKTFNGSLGKTKKSRVRQYKYQPSRAEAIKSICRKGFVFSVYFVLFSIAASSIASIYLYQHFSSIVENRIASGFWQSRAGIYAADHFLRAGQKLKQEEVVSMLRRAGYVEGANADFYNGSYKVEENAVVIHSNNTNNFQAETARIEFGKNKILRITSPNAKLESFAVEGEMLTGRSEAKRDANNALKYNQIPELLRNAIIATEDRRFFEHNGVDPQGILRALYTNISHNEIKQGGSTITQQLVKNTFLSSEKTLKRKISEMFLAIALENKMSKEDIFALYCNEIYFGQHGVAGIHGVEQASRIYFGKELKDLNLSEAATIAAMIKSPNRYSPAKNYERAITRRDFVIQNLQASGFISQTEAEKALQQEIALAPQKSDQDTLAPYFVDSVNKQLPLKLNNDSLAEDDNLRVYTTIDPQLQELAEKSVAEQLSKLDKLYAKKGFTPQATLIALNPKNGEVLAMVGGRDYNESQFNRATEARRQPGSVFKPFVYAAAIEKGILPTSTFPDKPMSFSYDYKKDYKPANYGGYYTNKEISMKTALAKSSNVVAVETALETGLDKVANTARKFGFDIEQAFPSIALGTYEATPMEIAAAYATFANEGKRVVPTFVSKVISGEGDVIFKNNSETEQIVSPKTAFMITDMLEAVVERGTARSAKDALGKDVVFAGKTGSSKDGWFVGYTPNLVTVVWIGFDDNKDIEMTGGEAALPVWVDFMRQAIDIRPELGGSAFLMPNGLVEITIDPETGMLADAFCPQSEKMVVPSYAATNIHCYKHQPKMPEMTVAQNFESIENYSEMTIPSSEIETNENVPTYTPDYSENDYQTEESSSVENESENKSETSKEKVQKTFLDESQIKTLKKKIKPYSGNKN